MEQQRDDLDRRALDRRGRRLLQCLFALVQLLEQHRRADLRAGQTSRHARRGEPPRNALLRVGDRRLQRRRCLPGLLGVDEFGQLATDQSIEPAEHRFGVVGAAHQAGRARHHPRLFVHLGARCIGRVRARVRKARTGAAGRPGRIARAADQRAQVDLGQHALMDQPAIGLVVRLFGEVRELVMQHRLQRVPRVVAQARRTPGRRHDAREHMRTQDVVGVELLAPLEHRDARAQVGELP